MTPRLPLLMFGLTRHRFYLVAFIFLAVSLLDAEAQPLPNRLPRPAWGRIIQATNSAGLVQLEIHQWPANGKLPLPTPFPSVTAAHLIDGRERVPLMWVLNGDATQLHLELPERRLSEAAMAVSLETTEKTTQFADGRIVFSALDANVRGSRAKLESHPGNHRIGFWTDAADSVSWEYKPTRWGMYDVELSFSADGGEGTELHFEIAGKSFFVARPSTGSWYRYQTLPVGRLYLAKSEPFTVRAACKTLKGAAVMNIKSVALRPAPEGNPIAQETDDAVTLHARDAITHSVLMRYEPETNKNCLGYWANVNDWVDWEFNLSRPGTFEIEVWQGCGKGHGGSDVGVEVGGKQFTFVVEDTGHFQTFLPRKIGRIQLARAGIHSLAIKPLRKQAGAVMDIRQVRLLPLKDALP